MRLLAVALAGSAAGLLASCHEPSYPAAGGFTCDPAAGADACPSGLTCHLDIKQCFPTDKLPARKFKLDLTVTGSGSVGVAPGGTMCSAACMPDFDAGAMVTLTATAMTDNALKEWGGACAGTTGDVCMVTMDVAKAVTATFAPLFNVQVTKVGTGQGTVSFAPEGITCGTDCFRYAEGATVTLTAAPTAPASFAGWGDACGGRGSCAITTSANRAVRAAFNAGNLPAVVKTFGSINDDVINAVAADATGNIYVTGSYRGTTDFGGMTQPVSGSSDLFVARYDRTGALAWVKTFGSASGDEAGLDLAVSATGVWVVGTFTGSSLELVTGTPLSNASTGTSDVFVAQLGLADGAPVFSERFGGTQTDTVAGITVAGDGFLFLTGTFRASATYGSTTQGTAVSGSVDGYLLRLTSTGVRSWFFRYGNVLDETSAALDNLGNDVVVTGTFEGSNLDFGCGGMNAVGSRDMYLARITTNVGTQGPQCVWSRSTGSPTDTKINDPAGVAVTSAGVVYLVSTYDDVITGTTALSRGGTDIAIEKFSAVGAPETTFQLGGAGNETAADIAVDLQNNVMVAGTSNGTIDLTAPFGFTARGTDAFAVKMSEGLVPIAGHTFGGAGDERARAVTFVPAGATPAAYLAGSFSGMGDFGAATPAANVGLLDAFLLEIAGQ